jgi:hypothetical protein
MNIKKKYFFTIILDNQPVYFRDWHLKGISYLNEIIDEQDKLYTWEEFSNKFKIENQAFKYYSLIHPIPKNWKKRIKESSKKLTVVTISRVLQTILLRFYPKYCYTK